MYIVLQIYKQYKADKFIWHKIIVSYMQLEEFTCVCKAFTSKSMCLDYVLGVRNCLIVLLLCSQVNSCIQ